MQTVICKITADMDLSLPKDQKAKISHMKLQEFANSKLTFRNDVIKRHFNRGTKVSGLAIISVMVGRFPSIIEFNRFTGHLTILDTNTLALVWGLIVYYLSIARDRLEDVQEKRKKAMDMNYDKLSRTMRNYSRHRDMCISTKTGGLTKKLGTNKIWAFTPQFLEEIDFDPNSTLNIYDFIVIKAKANGVSIRDDIPKQVVEGFQKDWNISYKYGLCPCHQELNLPISIMAKAGLAEEVLENIVVEECVDCVVAVDLNENNLLPRLGPVSGNIAVKAVVEANEPDANPEDKVFDETMASFGIVKPIMIEPLTRLGPVFGPF